MRPSYYVVAHWDPDASVWYSRTNIHGLVIEAATVAEFEQVMGELAPELLAGNENIHNERVAIEFTAVATREFAVI